MPPTASSFWDEDGSSLQAPIEAPAGPSQSASGSRGRQRRAPRLRRQRMAPSLRWPPDLASFPRRRAVAILGVLAATALIVVAVLGETEGGGRTLGEQRPPERGDHHEHEREPGPPGDSCARRQREHGTAQESSRHQEGPPTSHPREDGPPPPSSASRRSAGPHHKRAGPDHPCVHAHAHAGTDDILLTDEQRYELALLIRRTRDFEFERLDQPWCLRCRWDPWSGELPRQLSHNLPTLALFIRAHRLCDPQEVSPP